MQRERYPHKVAAVYPDADAAEAATAALDGAAPGDVRIVRLAPGARDIDLAVEPEPDGTRDTVVGDVFAGSAAGTAAGAVVAGTATVVTPALFVSAPVLGPLIVLGYGTMIGSLAGAIRGLKVRETLLAGIVKDALKAGCHVVIVHAASDEARQRAQAVIDRTMTEQTAHT